MNLNLLLTSDVHSYIVPTNYDQQKFNAPFGLERAATVIKKEQAKLTNVLTFDDGDYLEGSPLSAYLAKRQNRPWQIDDAFNLIHYDYGIVGNHEFNYGQKYLKNSLKESKRQFLCANITDKLGRHPFGKPYVIRDIDGIKVGIIGFTTQAIPEWEIPEHIKGLQFHSVVKTAKKYVPIMRQQADVIVVAYHGGFERDNTGHQTGTLDGENEGYELLKSVKGIDALLTGHQHRIIADHLFGVPVIQVGCKGQMVGQVTLSLGKKDSKFYIRNSQVKLIPTAHYPINQAMAQQIKPLEKMVDQKLNQPLAKIIDSLTYNDPKRARLQKCSFIELMQKIQMAICKTDLSATAIFSDQASGFKSPVTIRQVFSNYIFPNKLALSVITGKELKAALEQSAKYFTYSNDHIIVDKKYKHQGYYYLMYDGIHYVINVARPISHRITHLRYHGKPIQPDQKLKIALNNYNAVGGGNCYMFHPNQIKWISHQPLTTIISKYLKRHEVVRATNNHNFKVIYQP